MKFKFNKEKLKKYLFSLSSSQKKQILLYMQKEQNISFEKNIENCSDEEILKIFEKVVDFYV